MAIVNVDDNSNTIVLGQAMNIAKIIDPFIKTKDADINNWKACMKKINERQKIIKSNYGGKRQKKKIENIISGNVVLAITTSVIVTIIYIVLILIVLKIFKAWKKKK